MRIEIDRDMEVAKLKITTTTIHSQSPVFVFEFECGKDWVAELLLQRLQKEFDDSMKEMVRAAYDAGWKDNQDTKQKYDSEPSYRLFI